MLASPSKVFAVPDPVISLLSALLFIVVPVTVLRHIKHSRYDAYFFITRACYDCIAHIVVSFTTFITVIAQGFEPKREYNGLVTDMALGDIAVFLVPIHLQIGNRPCTPYYLCSH